MPLVASDINPLEQLKRIKRVLIKRLCLGETQDRHTASFRKEPESDEGTGQPHLLSLLSVHKVRDGCPESGGESLLSYRPEQPAGSPWPRTLNCSGLKVTCPPMAKEMQGDRHRVKR